MEPQSKSATDIIVGLLSSLTPDTVQLIQKTFGPARGDQAQAAVSDANAFMRAQYGGEGVDFFEGNMQAIGEPLALSFMTPHGSSTSERDAACFHEISRQTGVNYKFVKTISGL